VHLKRIRDVPSEHSDGLCELRASETVVIEAPSVFAMPVIVVPSEIETWRALHHPARARRRYPPEGGPRI
jgi:hypothetical protein